MNTLPLLNKIDQDYQEMISLVETWANINSGSENLTGLSTMLCALESTFSSLKGQTKRITLPPRKKINAQGHLIEVPVGQALSIIKRPNARKKVFLCGHMDTVYSASSSFQKTERLDTHLMRGPGVTDLKGGLVVMLKALETFEQTPFAEKLGWEILFNPDEEIGSPSSAFLLEESAQRNQIGLIFEPSLPDGALVSARKGSGNFTLVARGKAAHVGREYHLGRNAIHALATAIHQVSSLSLTDPKLIINFGQFEGGGPVNIVPDFAICRLNLRSESQHSMEQALRAIREILGKLQQSEGVELELHEECLRPPKPFDSPTQRLFENLKHCAKELDMEISWRETGGVCDGNILAAAGLPTIDTLGVVGGNIHTSEEYLVLSSLTERAKLVALFLMRYADN